MNYKDHLNYTLAKKSGPSFEEIRQRIFIQKTPLWEAIRVKQQDRGEKRVYLEVKEN